MYAIEKLGIQSPVRNEIWHEISSPAAPMTNSASTLTEHCWWEDKMARERSGHPPSYAEAKKSQNKVSRVSYPWTLPLRGTALLLLNGVITLDR